MQNDNINEVSGRVAAEAEEIAERPATGRTGLAAWCFYDWANSAFPTVITTFIFAAYFTQAVAPTPVEGTIAWSRALTIVGLTVAVTSPFLGAVADRLGRRKPWLAVFTALSAALTFCLWFMAPDPAFVRPAMVLFIGASVTFQFAMVFYDAMLPDLAPKGMVGRISGWGWATGYFGGLVCLTICLWLVMSGGADVFGLDKDEAEHVRATSILVAVWFGLFSLPLFLFTPDRASSGQRFGEAVRAGFRQIRNTPAVLRNRPRILRFLVAHMFYTDGLVTLFAFGGIYAAAEWGMTPEDILVFGIVLNISAGIGAAAFSWLDDGIGSKATILLALSGLIAFGTGLVLATSSWLFWALAIMLGLFVGPVQAAGRSMMARLAPRQMQTEMFGLYAMAGKATAFAGPLVLGLVVQWSGSQRAGMASVIAFLLAGALVLMTVREPDS